MLQFLPVKNCFLKVNQHHFHFPNFDAQRIKLAVDYVQIFKDLQPAGYGTHDS
jgi:hypothetical protein